MEIMQTEYEVRKPILHTKYEKSYDTSDYFSCKIVMNEAGFPRVFDVKCCVYSYFLDKEIDVTSSYSAVELGKVRDWLLEKYIEEHE